MASEYLEAAAKVRSPILVFIVGGIARKYLEAKPKIISYLVHASTTTLDNPERTNVNTHSIVVRNSGKKSAHNLRIGHYVLPAYSVVPPVNFGVVENPQGAREMIFPTLAPNEQVTISYLYFPPVTYLQINAYTKSDEGMAEIINVIPTPQLSKPKVWVIWVLLFIGASTALYWIILLIGYLIQADSIVATNVSG